MKHEPLPKTADVSGSRAPLDALEECGVAAALEDADGRFVDRNARFDAVLGRSADRLEQEDVRWTDLVWADRSSDRPPVW